MPLSHNRESECTTAYNTVNSLIGLQQTNVQIS